MKNAIMILILSSICIDANASLNKCGQERLDQARRNMVEEMGRLRLAVSDGYMADDSLNRRKTESDYLELVSIYGHISTCEANAIGLSQGGQNFQQAIDALYKCADLIPQKFVPSTTCN